MRAIESGQSVALDQRVKDGMVPISKVKESRRRIQMGKKSMSSFLDILKLKETLENPNNSKTFE